MMNRKALIATALILTVGCLTGGTRGHALYPATDPRPKLEELAMLTGYVEKVDGKDVTAYGASFELLPGCHLIGTPKEWGSFTNVGGVIAKTGRLLFALPMKPAHQYIIALRTGQIAGHTGSAVVDATKVEATEKDLDGNTSNVFGPARSRNDVEECRAWEAQSRPPDKTSTPPVDAGVFDGGMGDETFTGDR